jgi:hypothetical protein
VVGIIIDELIRHQPSLKKTVLEATLTFLSEIDRIQKAVDITASQVVNVQLKACVEESPQAAIKGASSSLLVAPSQSNPRRGDERKSRCPFISQQSFPIGHR